jgi:hypothetical protein
VKESNIMQNTRILYIIDKENVLNNTFLVLSPNADLSNIHQQAPEGSFY